MTRPLTAQIKPSTKGALMDQLALAAETIIDQRRVLDWSRRPPPRRPLWHRLLWWRK